MHTTLRIFAACALLAAPAALAGQTNEPAPATPPAPSAQAAALRPGDVLQIKVWHEPDLSGDFVVDEDGNVTLPLVGTRPVTRVPSDRLRSELLAAYARYLQNPAIVITPLRRINVGGEVNKPGLYPVDPTITLSGAIGVAGGVTPMGDPRHIRVIRDGQVLLQRANQAYTLHDIDIRSGDQIIVDRRGWFDRNSTFLVSALLSVTGIVTTIILNSGK